MDLSFWLRLLGVCSSNRLPLNLGKIGRSVGEPENKPHMQQGCRLWQLDEACCTCGSSQVMVP